MPAEPDASQQSLRGRGRAQLFTVLGATLMLAVIAFAILTTRLNGEHHETEVTDTTSAPTTTTTNPLTGSVDPDAGVPRLDAARFDAIEAALKSGDPARIVGAVRLPDQDQALSPDALNALAKLAPLDVDLASVRYLDSQTAAANATTSDTSKWTVFFILDNGAWIIAATTPQEG